MSSVPLIIGLSGRRGSGKDTVASLLMRRYRVERLAFADPLREAARAICGFSEEQCVNPALKEVVDPRWGFSPRQFLQRLGTDVGRAFDENLWVKRWIARANTALATGRGVVVTDVRFPNELEAVRSLGGKVYRVERNQGRPDASPVDAHASETALDTAVFDGVILNNGTLDDLDRVVGDLFGYHRAPLSVVTEDGCLKLPQDVVDHLKLDPTRGVSFVRRFRAAGRIGLVPVVEVVADDAYLQLQNVGMGAQS